VKLVRCTRGGGETTPATPWKTKKVVWLSSQGGPHVRNLPPVQIAALSSSRLYTPLAALREPRREACIPFHVQHLMSAYGRLLFLLLATSIDHPANTHGFSEALLMVSTEKKAETDGHYLDLSSHPILIRNHAPALTFSYTCIGASGRRLPRGGEGKTTRHRRKEDTEGLLASWVPLLFRVVGGSTRRGQQRTSQPYCSRAGLGAVVS